MKKLLALLLLIPALALAKAPEEDDILNRTTDSSSPFYYTNLLLRYNNGDSTLTPEDYHYLYYGYANQESYKPLEGNNELDLTLLIASRINPDQPLREDLEALISAAGNASLCDPFSPKLLNLMAYAYGALGDTIRERQYFDRMQGVIGAINDSGDGFTQETPRHILMFDHALDAMTAADLAGGKARVISRNVEFIPLTEPTEIDGKKRKGLYFDFSRIYRNKPEGYTYKRDRTWQFNNLKAREYK